MREPHTTWLVAVLLVVAAFIIAFAIARYAPF